MFTKFFILLCIASLPSSTLSMQENQLDRFIARMFYTKLTDYFAAHGQVNKKLKTSLNAYSLYAKAHGSPIINPDACDENEMPFLIKAAQQADLELVKLLLQAHMNPNAKDSHNSTALIEAAKNIMIGYKADDALQILKLLLIANANPNAQDFLGTTALIYLTHSHCAESISVPVRLLVIHGADSKLHDCSGKSAIDYCGKDIKFDVIRAWMGSIKTDRIHLVDPKL